jgi:hypothetical protein
VNEPLADKPTGKSLVIEAPTASLGDTLVKGVSMARSPSSIGTPRHACPAARAVGAKQSANVKVSQILDIAMAPF